MPFYHKAKHETEKEMLIKVYTYTFSLFSKIYTNNQINLSNYMSGHSRVLILAKKEDKGETSSL